MLLVIFAMNDEMLMDAHDARDVTECITEIHYENVWAIHDENVSERVNSKWP